MEWPIKVDLGKGYFVDASLTMSTSHNEVMVGFIDPLAKETLIYDKFSSFYRIEFSDIDPLHVKLIGTSITRSFKFQKEDALSEMWMLLQKVFKFGSIPGKCRAFSITKKEERPSLLSYITGHKAPSSTAPLGNRIPEALSSGVVRMSLSELDITVINQSNLEHVFTNGSWTVPIEQIEVQDGFEFDLWLKILKVDVSETRKADFRKLESLWQGVQRCQWEKHARMRDFVHHVETALLSNESIDDAQKKLVFHVSMSIFMWNYNEYVASDNFMGLVLFLVKYLVAASDGDDFICRNGFKISMVDASFLVFSVFSKVYDRVISPVLKDDTLKTLYNDTIELLEEQSPASTQLLCQANVTDFDFLKPCISNFFTDGRRDEDAVTMFTALVSCDDLHLFLRCFISTALVLLHTRLVESAPQTSAAFGDLFVSLLPSVDVRLMLFNSARLIDLCIMENEP